MTAEQKVKMKEDYEKGMSVSTLAQEYSISEASIIRNLKLLGVYNYQNDRWTDEEIKVLKEYYPSGQWDILYKKLPSHSKTSIQKKCSKLGIKAESYHWIESDIEILKKHYRKKSNVDIQSMLKSDRTIAQIRDKAISLGLGISRTWTEDEIKILKESYSNKTINEMLLLLPNRTNNSIKLKARQLNLSSGVYYTEADDKFIRDNWETISDEEIGEVIGRPAKGVQMHRTAILKLKQPKQLSSYLDLSDYVRQMNFRWKQESRNSSNNRCMFTGGTDTEIHHKHGFSLILKDVIEKNNIEAKDTLNDYTQEELDYICDLFYKEQLKYPLGACITKEIHMQFHNIYGYGNNTIQQWEEFEKQFKNSMS